MGVPYKTNYVLLQNTSIVTYRFKTNINCSSCVGTVTPHLNVSSIQSWNVDTANKDKVLEVATASLSEKDVISLVENAGFKIESAKKRGLLNRLFS